MGAPIRLAMNAVLNKSKAPKPCQIDYRKKERYWVFGSEKEVNVTFEVDFNGETDQALARIFLLELNDSKRSVMSAPGVVYHDKSHPENIERMFPGVAKNRTSNGSITFQVGETHLKKGLDQPLS